MNHKVKIASVLLAIVATLYTATTYVTRNQTTQITDSGSRGPASVTDTQAPALPSDGFSIVAIPDAQFYQTSNHWVFTDQLQWIVTHQNDPDKQVKIVLGLGDIVDAGGPAPAGTSCKGSVSSSWQEQWTNASTAVDTYLDSNKIPYMLTIGNHDYDCEADYIAGYPQSRSTLMFDHYFGPSRYANATWFSNGGTFTPGSNSDFFNEFQINGLTYLILSLEFYPRNSALDWAGTVISQHPNDRVIIITHAYLFPDGSTPGSAHEAAKDPSGAGSYNLGPNYPENVETPCGKKICSNGNNGIDMWNNFVSKYSNIVLVLSGHFEEPGQGNNPPPNNGVGYLTRVGANGNQINEIVSDYQGQGGNGYFGRGYLRMYTIIPSQGTLTAQTFSPAVMYHPGLFTTALGGLPPETKTDGHNAFTLSYVDPIAGNVTIVKPALTASGEGTKTDPLSVTNPVSLSAVSNWPGHKITKMTLFLDGVGDGTQEFTGTHTATFNASLTLPSGTHRLRVMAFDSNNNSILSNPVYVSVP